MADIEIAGAVVLAVALAAFGSVWQVQAGEPLWEVPASWVLPDLPRDPQVAQHFDHGAGSIADVRAVLSFVDYQRAADVWDEAHEADWWFAFNRSMDAAFAEFHGSDAVIRRAHRTVRCWHCAHPYVDEPTGEYPIVPAALVGAA